MILDQIDGWSKREARLAGKEELKYQPEDLVDGVGRRVLPEVADKGSAMGEKEEEDGGGWENDRLSVVS